MRRREYAAGRRWSGHFRLTGIYHVLGQRADDAVAPRVDLADFVFMFTRRFNDAACARIDDCGDAA